MKRNLLVCLALTLPAVAVGQSSAAEERAASSITSEDILARIAIIADDSMRGRVTPSAELDLTAAYVASQFRQFGLKAAGDEGGYIQRYSLLRVAARYLVVSTSNKSTWHAGKDLLQLAGGTAESLSGPTVLIGGSGDLPSEPDLSGAVVVLSTDLIRGKQGGFDPQSEKLIRAIRERDAAAIIVASDFPQSTWDSLARRDINSQLVKGWKERPEGIPVLAVRSGAAKSVLSAQGYKLPRGKTVTVRKLDDLEFRVTVRHQIEEYFAPNVIGILEGSDPQLKNEYVAFSAHMDHVGIGKPVKGDSIYNGADDDASGTVAVVEAAQAFSMLQPRPKRSMIFLTVSGEEKGLWGSEYFTTHPSVPITQIVADINIDMIGRNWTDKIVVIGKKHSDLGTTLSIVEGRHPELDMTAIDDIWPEENFYYRSDHFNFARNGVPILFFFNGTHEDYHKPGDEVGKIDTEKESRIVKLVFYLGLSIANAAERPKWNPDSYEKILEGPGR